MNTLASESLDSDKFIIERRIFIGHSIREIREKRGLSQEQLAEKMNISRSTISKIESGKFNCSIDYLSKFSYSLGFDLGISDNSNSHERDKC